MSDQGDGWKGGGAYDFFMGRWSRRLAPDFVRWLGVGSGARWLDVGSGTGALAESILRDAAPRSVHACDASAELLEVARRRLRDPRVEFVVAEAGAGLPRVPDGFDAVVSSFALNFFPDPHASLREQVGRAAPGGVIAACVWDYREGMEFLRHFWDAAVQVSPLATELDEGRRFPVCDPTALRDLWGGAGLTGIRVESLSVPTVFSGFDDFWTPFLGGAGPAPRFVAGLSTAGRQALTDALARSLPRRADGSIALSARAWVVKGSVGSGAAIADGEPPAAW